MAGRPLLQLPGVPDPHARGVLRRGRRCGYRAGGFIRAVCSTARSAGPAGQRPLRHQRALPAGKWPGVSPPTGHERARGDRPPSTRFRLLPSADEQLLALPLLALSGHRRALRGVAIEAVIHYPSYTASVTGRERLVSAVQRGLLRSGVFSQLHFVNYLQYEDVQAHRWWWQRMARAAGDPVPQPPRLERRAARVALGVDPSGRYLGMIGGLDARNAVPATLAAFRAAKLPSHRPITAGWSDDARVANLVREDYADLVGNGTLVVLDRFLSGQELAQGFAALDVHCSVYHRFAGLSSLMLEERRRGSAGHRRRSTRLGTRDGASLRRRSRRRPSLRGGFARALTRALDARATMPRRPRPSAPVALPLDRQFHGGTRRARVARRRGGRGRLQCYRGHGWSRRWRPIDGSCTERRVRTRFAESRHYVAGQDKEQRAMGSNQTPPGVRARPYRFGLDLEHPIGNMTRYLNLRKYAEQDSEIDFTWAPVATTRLPDMPADCGFLPGPLFMRARVLQQAMPV